MEPPNRLPPPAFPIGTTVMRKQTNGVIIVEKVTTILWLPTLSRWKYRLGNGAIPYKAEELTEYEIVDDEVCMFDLNRYTMTSDSSNALQNL